MLPSAARPARTASPRGDAPVRYAAREVTSMSSSSCSPFASATTAPRKPCGARWSEPFMISTGSSAASKSPCAASQPCSRSSRTLASSGSTAPLPYPVGRYSARTVLPSGLDHQKAVRFTALGTPRQTTASSKPNCLRIWGIWATWPNMSGRYPTRMEPPKAAARSSPSCRSRTIVSPETRNSSMRTYQGPIATRPVAASRRSRFSASGRTAR